jgi:ABC-type transporter MlaC component
MKSEQRKLYEKAYKTEYAKRHKQVTITLTNQQYSLFEQQAKKEKTKVATLIKNMAVAYQQQDNLIPTTVVEELKELKFLIRNIANNVNQMAHYSNTIHSMVDDNAFLAEIQKLEKAVNDYTLNKFKKA